MIKNLEIDKNSDFRIYEGERHPKLISIANSLLFTHLKPDLSNLNKLKDFFDKIAKIFVILLPCQKMNADSIWEDSVVHVKECQNSKNEQKEIR